MCKKLQLCAPSRGNIDTKTDLAANHSQELNGARTCTHVHASACTSAHTKHARARKKNSLSHFACMHSPPAPHCVHGGGERESEIIHGKKNMGNSGERSPVLCGLECCSPFSLRFAWRAPDMPDILFKLHECCLVHSSNYARARARCTAVKKQHAFKGQCTLKSSILPSIYYYT